MSQEELVVDWRVYEPCNLGCHFCGYSREIVRKRHIASPQEILRFGKILSEFQISEIMDTDDLLKIAGQFRFKQLHSRAAQCNNCLSTQVFEKFDSNLPGENLLPGNRG